MHKCRTVSRSIFMTILLAPLFLYAQHKGINFQGVIKKSDGTLPNVSGITVTVQFLDPVHYCILREEEHSGKNISNGYLNLVLGDSSASTPAGKNPSPVLSISEALNNQVSRTGLSCVDIQNNITSSNQTYIPSNLDRRIVRVRFNLQGEEVAADFNMRAVGFAVNSEMINGKTDSDFVNVNGAKGVTQSNLENIFEQSTKLNALLGNTNGTGDTLGVNITGNAATATTASTILGGLNALLPSQAGHAGKYLTTDGSNVSWAPVVNSGGTITEVIAGAGLTGGGSAGSVTVSLSNVGTAGTYAKVTTDPQGRVTAGGNLSSSDIPFLDAAKISSGTFGDSMLSDLDFDKLINAATKYFNYKPNNVACNTNEVLKYDDTLDSSNGGWKCASDNTLIAPGDASYSVKGLVQFNTDAPTSGFTVSGGVASLNTGTSPYQIVKLDEAAKLPAIDGSQLLNLPVVSSFTGSLAGDVTGNQASTNVEKIKGQAVTATGSSPGQVLRYAGSNNWTPGFVAMTDLRSAIAGMNAFATSCGAHQTLTYNSVGEVMSCLNISIVKEQVSDFPVLASVATTGSYNDLSNKPTIPAAQVNADWNAVSGVSQVLNKPSLGTLASKSTVTSSELSAGAVTSAELATSSVTDAKIVSLSSSKLFNDVDVARLPVASSTSDGIVTNTTQSFSGIKTFINNVIAKGSMSMTGLLTASGGVTTTSVVASGAGQFDRVKLAHSTVTCDGTTEGSMRYNSVNKRMDFCNGSIWVAMAPKLSCPLNFIPVPPLDGYASSPFCVAKYEMRNTGSNVAVSQPSGTPWVNIQRGVDSTIAGAAWKACKDLGSNYDLISNSQWQAIARNIESVDSNWSGGVVGSGSLNRGHTNGAAAISAYSDDNNACVGTGQSCSRTVWHANRRIHTLSNGMVIWDFSGNVWEWVRDNYPDLGINPSISLSWNEFSSLSATNKAILGSANGSWNSVQGLGRAYGGAGGALVRGGRWANGDNAGIFSVDMQEGPTYAGTYVGFRCVYVP